jgi:hypothetical protein
MLFKFTVKIRDERNPPIFKEELGKGVLSIIEVNIEGVTEEDLNKPLVISEMFNRCQDFANEWIKVTYEPIEAEK